GSGEARHAAVGVVEREDLDDAGHHQSALLRRLQLPATLDAEPLLEDREPARDELRRSRRRPTFPRALARAETSGFAARRPMPREERLDAERCGRIDGPLCGAQPGDGSRSRLAAAARLDLLPAEVEAGEPEATEQLRVGDRLDELQR